MTTTKNPTTAQTLAPFIGPRQMRVLTELLKGEERQHFDQTLRSWALLIQTMPKTGETDSEGHEAVAQLHYFVGGADWYITERDMGDGSGDATQHQAFGYANLGDDDCAEFGYISLPELFTVNAELDLYWEPKPLSQCDKFAA